MTDLYEAGDVNQTGGSDNSDNDVDDVDDVDDINVEILDDDSDDSDDSDDDDDDNYEDDEVGVGNEVTSVDGGTPLAVLEYLAKSLSDEPDAVNVETEDRRGGVRLNLHVAPSDMGRVIGRRGRTAQAIRTLVNVAGAKDGVQASVDIVDD
ncbi:MAG TPA: KH domain-containing protein [Acidimicrobiales bacterium]